MNQPPKAKVFLEGRYRKLCRDLPQTVFFCPECKGHPRRRRKCARCEGFGKLTRDSVQELIGWVAGKAFGSRRNKFHGAGREDVDVRMLGEGRPFILEIVGPRSVQVDLAAVEAEINRRNAGRLEVVGLHWSEKTRVPVLKETAHAKEYEALVEVEGELDAARAAALLEQRTLVVQHTPERVAHRRADLDRERWFVLLGFESAPAPSAPAEPAAARPLFSSDEESAAADASELDASEPDALESAADFEAGEAPLVEPDPNSGADAYAQAAQSSASPAPAQRSHPAARPQAEAARIPTGPLSYWRARLRTQHGTYVKEILSGDGGNTRPSLGELLGVRCRCLELDVTSILDEQGGELAQAGSERATTAAAPGFGAGLG